MVFRITDLPLSGIIGREYDLALFAVGYEERCTNLALVMHPAQFRNTLIFGFEEHASDVPRARHSAIFKERFGAVEQILRFDDEGKIFDLLRAYGFDRQNVVNIFVDYSSMSRMWYNSILKFFRHGHSETTVNVDFAYTVGEYPDIGLSDPKSVQDFSIQDILCVPGLEGSAMRQQRSIAILGLGFEWLPAFGIAEVLEADTVVGFIADPGAFPDYARIAEDRNAEFLREYSREPSLMRLPLRSVETTYRALASFIAPYRQTANILLVPLGPKPHVLASILLAARFSDVACLYAKTSRHRPPRVPAASPQDIVGTRVELDGQS